MKKTKSEQRQIATQGGIASGEARRRKRDLKYIMEILLETDAKGMDGVTNAQAIALKQLEKALKGDSKSFEIVRDTAGQKPIDRLEVATIEDTTRQEMEAYFGRQRTDQKPAKE